MSQPRAFMGHQRGQSHRVAIRELMLEHMRGLHREGWLSRLVDGSELQSMLLDAIRGRQS